MVRKRRRRRKAITKRFAFQANAKNTSYIFSLMVEDLWQIDYQILSIIFLKEFIELNVNFDTTINNIKHVELNINVATVFLNRHILKVI